ncbi:MAG: hypothetical protein IT209_06770 [Armatimonadetes bacterium]|nr:hypothetical protein [Armatimonadota bacterium]
MGTRQAALIAVAILGIAEALYSSPSRGETTGYSALQIVPEFGHVCSIAALNNNGAVLGVQRSPNANLFRAFLWQDGVARDIQFPKDQRTVFPEALNDSNQIVGNVVAGDLSAFRWDSGRLTLLSVPEGWPHAYGINNCAMIVGSTTVSGLSRAIAWTPDGVVDIGASIDGTSTARLVNSSGQVAGVMRSPDSPQQHAFLWTNGHVTDLGNPGVGFACNPLGLDDTGGVLLQWQTVSGSGYGLWRAGALEVIGELPRPISDSAGRVLMNGFGSVVWAQYGQTGGSVRILDNGSWSDVTSLITEGIGSPIREIVAYNNAGQLVASSPQGNYYLLTPTPEPVSIVMTGVGLSLAALARTMRRRV